MDHCILAMMLDPSHLAQVEVFFDYQTAYAYNPVKTKTHQLKVRTILSCVSMGVANLIEAELLIVGSLRD